jgi:hypothetical protein
LLESIQFLSVLSRANSWGKVHNFLTGTTFFVSGRTLAFDAYPNYSPVMLDLFPTPRLCVALFLLNYEIGSSKGSELHESVVCGYIHNKPTPFRIATKRSTIATQLQHIVTQLQLIVATSNAAS